MKKCDYKRRNFWGYRLRNWARQLNGDDFKIASIKAVDLIGTVIACVLLFAALFFFPHAFH